MDFPRHNNAFYSAHNSRCGLSPGAWAGQKRFRLKRLIGSGGMGEVWLAYDSRLREFVALKFLLPKIANNIESIEHLRIETHRSRKLSHPNIVRIYDLYEEAGEIPFIAMEYVDGSSLHQLRLLRSNGVLNWEFISPLIRQLIAALQYAHSENIVHRDIKPSNLLLDKQNRLKLADFGIARIAQQTSFAQRGLGFGGGTLDFISPQQASGMPPTPADDIYSVGSTLYELLTGTPPFYKGDIEYQLHNIKPQPLSERLLELGIQNPVPDALENFVQSCLEKNPEKRPVDYKDLIRWTDLIDEQFAGAVSPDSRTIQTSPAHDHNNLQTARPPKQTNEIPPEIPEPARSIRLSDLIKFALGILLLGFAGGIIFTMATHKIFKINPIDKPQPSTAAAPQLQNPTNRSSENVIKLTPQKSEQKPISETSKSNTHNISNAIQTAKTSTEKSNFVEKEKQIGKLISQFPKPLISLNTTPDSLWTLVADSDGLIKMIDTRTGNVIKEEKIGTGQINTLAISPNGRHFLAGNSDGALGLFNIAGFEKLMLWENHKAPITCASFSNLRYAATADANGTIILWDVIAGRFVTEIKTKIGPITDLLFLTGKNTLAIASESGIIIICAVPTGKLEKMTQAHRNKVLAIAYNYSNRHIFSADMDNIIKVIDPDTLKEIKQTRQRTAPRESFEIVRFSPDGKTIAAISSLNYLYLYDSESLNQIKKLRLNLHSGKITDARWLTDNKSLLTAGADGLVCLWEINN
ncbi:MAG: WD40 repeat domain-containing serine/threonine protein kinase [Verrucomicrobiia bacterium]